MLAFPLLHTQGFPLFLDHVAGIDPATFSRLLLDNGAFHTAQALRLPPNIGLVFFPPYPPARNPLERLWRDLKDWLAHSQPTSLTQVSKLLGARLKHYTPSALRSLTGFHYLLTAAQQVSV